MFLSNMFKSREVKSAEQEAQNSPNAKDESKGRREKSIVGVTGASLAPEMLANKVNLGTKRGIFCLFSIFYFFTLLCACAA